jgi:hypothetical protein
VTIRFADSRLPPEWASVRLLLDDNGVTPIAVISPDAISFAPEWDLEFGNHRVTLEVMDAAGNILPLQEWVFIIPHSELFDRVPAEMRVDTELAHEVYQKDDSPQPDWTVQSNATFLSRVETADFKASLEGAPLDNDQLTSRLFEEKLNLTAEYSMSDFDEDTSDDIDSAIFLAAGGRRRPLPLPSLSPGCGGDV